MMKAIDIHSHFNRGIPEDKAVDPITEDIGLDSLTEKAGSLGIGATAYSSFAGILHPETIPNENEWLHVKTQEMPTVYQWIVLDPRNPETYRQADAYLDDPKCLGIKLHPYFHGYDILTYADGIFDFAAKRHATVLIHPDRISETAQIAAKYPTMRLILAHLGGKEWLDALTRYENVYTDTSGGASFGNRIIENAVAVAGADKILFGTDTYAPAAHLGRIVFSELSETDKEKILFRNALRLFAEKWQVSA